MQEPGKGAQSHSRQVGKPVWPCAAAKAATSSSTWSRRLCVSTSNSDVVPALCCPLRVLTVLSALGLWFVQ
jgi:hypothetical protein